jgi:hypothetical protein
VLSGVVVLFFLGTTVRKPDPTGLRNESP